MRSVVVIPALASRVPFMFTPSIGVRFASVQLVGHLHVATGVWFAAAPLAFGETASYMRNLPRWAGSDGSAFIEMSTAPPRPTARVRAERKRPMIAPASP